MNTLYALPSLLQASTANQIEALPALTALFFIIVFIGAWLLNRVSIRRIRHSLQRTQDISAIMQHTLSLRNNYVLRLSVQEQYAHNMHGTLLPPQGLSYDESLQLIHPDDRDTFRNFIVRLMTGAAKTDECVFRWDISGQEHRGEWRYMHDRGVAEYLGHGQKMPTTIFCILNDETELVRQEQQTEELTDRYRKIFEQSIVGLAFYDHEGRLLTANRKMRQILNFQSEHDPYYFEHTIYDMPAFRDIINNRHIEELYFCTKSVIMDRGVNCYTEVRVHPIFDEQQQLVYITFSIRDVTQERELYLKNRDNDEQLRRSKEEIQQYENELQYLMENCDMRFWRTSFDKREIVFYKGLSKPEKRMSFDEYQTYFQDDDGIIARNFANPEKYFSEPTNYVCQMKAVFHDTDELQWNGVDSIPYFDEHGRQLGCYGMLRNLTDLIKKQELLRQETERANDSSHMKALFMANMTHEIRTPLNSIVGFSDVLPLMQSQEEKQEIVRVIMNNCDMLLRLINDILVISTIDSSGISITPEEVDFAQKFNDICESLAQRVQNPAVQFINDNPYSSLVTTLDNGRIQQVITNFVTNAVKYTQQGHIKVGYRVEKRQQADGLYIYCEDTGAGIPKEQQKKVFERFVKLNDFVQGTGLGLSICKAIAEQSGGCIGVDSEGEGHGSTFWMWIPCSVKSATNNQATTT